MSTNDAQYLEDRGINRRWWPIVIDRENNNKADIKWLTENREQLFAEAVVKIDDVFWDFSEEAQNELEELRDEKRVEDETLAPILEWYATLDAGEREEGITKKEGFDNLGSHKDPTDFDLKKVGEFYVDVLHLIPARKKRNGFTRRVFIPTKNTPSLEGMEIEHENF